MKKTYLNPFNQTFGLPPSSHVSDEMIFNSMPTFEITPCKPYFESGLNLFKVEEDFPTYNKILANHGFTTPNPIKLAFIADNFPTDSFVNDYGETFLQKFTDVASQGMSQMAQMMGARTATEAGKIAGKKFTQAGTEVTGMMGDMLKTIGKTTTGLSTALEEAAGSKAVRSLIGGGGDVINKMIAGHRVDFPQVWRNSSYTPSYTATVRLYNPNPGNEVSTKHHIIGPLAAILCLSLPRTTDGNTFNWPFFHKVKAKGIYNLDPAVITNITVVKGGDQQQIAYNQNMGIVDVRIDFVSLFNSILLEESGKRSNNRPTLRSYLASMETEGTNYKRSVVNQKAASSAGANTSRFIATAPTSSERDKIAIKEQISGHNATAMKTSSSDPIRIESAITDIFDALKAQTPGNFIG